MKELIELRKDLHEEVENARRRLDDLFTYSRTERGRLEGGFRAFSDVIKKIDLILENSVINPTDSRSPEGQGYRPTGFVQFGIRSTKV